MALINILKKLSELANSLDKKGYYKEASDLDSIIKAAAYGDPWFQTPFSTKKHKVITESQDLEELKKSYETLSPEKKRHFLDAMEDFLDNDYYSAGYKPPKYVEDFLRDEYYNLAQQEEEAEEEESMQEAYKKSDMVVDKLKEMLWPIAQKHGMSDESFNKLLEDHRDEIVFDIDYTWPQGRDMNLIVRDLAFRLEDMIQEQSKDYKQYEETRNIGLWEPEQKQIEYRDPSELEGIQYEDLWKE